MNADEILAAIEDTFTDATENDVSLFYYSGHGVSSNDINQRGALLGNDGEDYVTADQLRSALDRIPGRKIVIIDACYSGSVIAASSALRKSKDIEDEITAEEFVDSFISAFSAKKRGNLAADGYFVLTAASADEESWEAEIDGRVMGMFTYYLTQGWGYTAAEGIGETRPADVNGNGVITLYESYGYAQGQMQDDPMQHFQVYPADCKWFGILRE